MKLKEKLSAKLKNQKGFTLIEMLIVVALIAILVFISIPMVTTSLDEARTATDKANVRAAKAAATIEYMTMETRPAAGAFGFYDAAKGTIETSDANIEPYAQAQEGGKNIIQVSITKADGKETITCAWVPKSAPSSQG